MTYKQMVAKKLRDAAVSLVEEFERGEGPVPGTKKFWYGRSTDPYREPCCTIGHVLYRAGYNNAFDVPNEPVFEMEPIFEANDKAPDETRREAVVPPLREFIARLDEYVASVK